MGDALLGNASLVNVSRESLVFGLDIVPASQTLILLDKILYGRQGYQFQLKKGVDAMAAKGLSSQLGGLFSDIGLEPEAEKSRARLGEAIVAGLIDGQVEAEPTMAGPMAVEALLSVLAKPEKVKEEREIFRANLRFQKVAPSKQRISRVVLNTATMVVPAYVAAIAGAEAIGVFSGVVPGALCHAILILALLSHYVLMDEAPYRRVLPFLALAPLLRLLSLMMPVRQVPQICWYVMVGTPLLMAVVLTARLLDLSWANLGLCPRSWRSQIFIALRGLPLSMAAFLLLEPKAVTAGFDWRDMVIGSLILTVFAGFLEEIVFRGMLQQVASEKLGGAAVVCSSTLFAIMHMGSLPSSYVLFIGLVGLFFGWCVKRTGSI